MRLGAILVINTKVPTTTDWFLVWVGTERNIHKEGEHRGRHLQRQKQEIKPGILVM